MPEDVLLDLKAIWEQHVDSSKVTKNHPSLPQQKQSTSLHNGSVGLAAQLDGVDSSGDEQQDMDDGHGDGKMYERPARDPEEITSEDDEPGAEDADVLLDTENVLVCQFDKIDKKKNKFHLQLKAGIMTINEKDYVFNRCIGQAEW